MTWSFLQTITSSIRLLWGDFMILISKLILLVVIVVNVIFPESVPNPVSLIKAITTPHYKNPILEASEHPIIKSNGQIISLSKIKDPNNPKTIETYRMMYWSQGKKVEAYVAAPKKLGDFPMFVQLHGGYVIPEYNMHVKSLINNGETIPIDQSFIDYAEEDVITLAPMYQGYGESEGLINGINSNTIDTQNAIKALKGYLDSNKHFPHVEKGHLYVEGSSMGGGVAMKLASERSDIMSVVAISPFIGWDITANWEKAHDQGAYETFTFYYGPLRPNATKIKKDSIDFSKIKAPTLLVQGTKDPNVEWETVQTFYNKMKADHKNVTFKLIKGGNHGLTNKEDQLTQIYNDWYDAHSQD